MTEKTLTPLLTLSIDIIYRILDKLDNLTLLCSVRDVCARLNKIVDTYNRYQVIFYIFIADISFIATNYWVKLMSHSVVVYLLYTLAIQTQQEYIWS